MSHVLHDAENLRQQRRAAAISDYRRIVLNYDSASPDDAAKLLDLLPALEITRHDCALHIEGVEECRHLTRQIERLRQEQTLQAEMVERAKGVAANITATVKADWTNRPHRDAIKSKVENMEADASNIAGRITAMHNKLAEKMRGLSMIYTPAEIQAA